MKATALSLALLFLVAMIVCLLPSCAEYPITGRIVGPQGAVEYSAKGGLTFEIDTRSGK
jgi:hypothetical protein